jgi:hypothetical protein
MGYDLALKQAGAKVLGFEKFGDWQGTWAAVVKYNDKFGVVTGSFGSCSYCDAFQSEFDDMGTFATADGEFYVDFEKVSEEAYNLKMADHDERLANFGLSYLTVVQDLSDIENQLKHVNADDWFGDERLQLLTWCKTNLLKFINN